MKKIEIMGCGYIGLPTAITFTLAGFEVCGFDVKQAVVDQLSSGKIHIVEPGLQDALTQALATGSAALYDEAGAGRVFIIAVQTPYKETEDHKRVSDMRFVESAAREVGTVAKPGDLCVLGVDVASLFHAAGGVDCGRGQRHGQERFYDCALPGADYPRQNAPGAA